MREIYLTELVKVCESLDGDLEDLVDVDTEM
jgi:DNA-binding Xre family transcriptional regulator